MELFMESEVLFATKITHLNKIIIILVLKYNVNVLFSLNCIKYATFMKTAEYQVSVNIFYDAASD